MKKHLLTLTACILTFQLFAQEIYGPAQIINLKGDTSQVLLSNFTSTREIAYRNNYQLKPVVATPDKIKGYILNNNTYLSKYVNITSYTLNKTLASYSFMFNRFFLEKDMDVKPHKDSLFLQLLLKGRVSLYKLVSFDEMDMFYVEREGRMHELPPVYHEFKADSGNAVSYGYFVQNGIYNKIPRFSGTFYERKSFVDTLMNAMATEEFYTKNSIRKSLQEMKYSAADFIALLSKYNSEYPEEGSEIKYKKGKFGKIYFGFTAGQVIPLKDYYNPKGQKINASNTLIYSIFAIIPNYGKNRNISYKVVFHQCSYEYTGFVDGYNYQMKRQLTSFALGLRYAVVKGYFRPYFGWSLTYTSQKVNTYKDADGFPMLFEAGALIPIKKVNLMLQANFSPILSEQAGFQYFGYSAGLMF
jgi:hypothetical protein